MDDLKQWINSELGGVVDILEADISGDPLVHTREGINVANRAAVFGVLDRILSILFPGVLGSESLGAADLNLFLCDHLRHVAPALATQAERVLDYVSGKAEGNNRKRADQAVIKLIKALPGIRQVLLTDIEAAYEGDPAALSKDEVLISYPCIEAIATQRIAHQLFLSGVPIIPRTMTERAHSRTGIDIHPGASIGPYFFIDHGTGVVIGETTVIGKRVKLYQGVTLGALSFPKDGDGRPIKGVKRHPNIEDDVIIYAGATVLGGETVIGRGSVISGNCWVTASVPPNSRVHPDHTSSGIR